MQKTDDISILGLNSKWTEAFRRIEIFTIGQLVHAYKKYGLQISESGLLNIGIKGYTGTGNRLVKLGFLESFERPAVRKMDKLLEIDLDDLGSAKLEIGRVEVVFSKNKITIWGPPKDFDIDSPTECDDLSGSVGRLSFFMIGVDRIISKWTQVT